MLKYRGISEWRKAIIGLAGLGLVAGSIYTFNIYIEKKETNQTFMQTLKPVRLLQSGEVITPNLIRFVSIPDASHNKEGILDPNALIGKVVVVPIGGDEEIYSWKLSDARTVPAEGERYHSFKTDSIENVSNMVRKGDSVDVWVEFDTPRQIKYSGGSLNVSAIKILEKLRVASVKTGDGVEVDDSNPLDAVLQNDSDQLAGARGKPSGKPEANTYIMTDEIYNAYVTGSSIGGHIKLALPNLTAKTSEETKITDLFSQLSESNALKAETMQIKGNIKPSDISESNSQNKQNEPVAKEVN